MNRLSKNQRKLIIDMALILLLIFLIPDLPFVTIPAHEMAGFSVGFVLAAHVALNWKWVVSISRRAFGHFGDLPRRTQIDYGINAAMAILFPVALVSGIAISTTLGMNPSPALISIHHESASLTTLLMLVHLARHWKWLWSNGRRVIMKRVPAEKLA